MKTLLYLLIVLCILSCSEKQNELPNIVFILADDMGYGDIQASNSESEIPTPNLNKFSEEGMMFTDAHTPSSICTPTRYGLLTGRYCWRTSLKRGVLRGYDTPLIENDRKTIADYLKQKGYRTGIVGKWHLGLGFQKNETPEVYEGEFDLTKPLYTSPNNNGFDYSFIHPASLDFEPYVYVKNYEVVEPEFDSVPETLFPIQIRKGIKSKSLEFDEVLDDLLAEALGFIEREAKSSEPFFLYFPLTAPHTPIVPGQKFKGISNKGLYGDFTIQIDWTAGEIFNLLEQLNIEDNTVVIFTSDNGSAMRKIESTTGPDHITDASLRQYNKNSHLSNGIFRGLKGDTYEGGHRVPFIIRWPKKLAAGKKVDATICLTDIFETFVDLTGGVMPEGNAEDSYSFYPILIGDKEEIARPVIIHHSGGKGMYAIRKDNWKLILGNGSGARTKPVGTPFEKPYQLFDLENDITESNNLIEKETGKAKDLEAEFYKIKGAD